MRRRLPRTSQRDIVDNDDTETMDLNPGEWTEASLERTEWRRSVEQAYGRLCRVDDFSLYLFSRSSRRHEESKIWIETYFECFLINCHGTRVCASLVCVFIHGTYSLTLVPNGHVERYYQARDTTRWFSITLLGQHDKYKDQSLFARDENRTEAAWCSQPIHYTTFTLKD